MPTNRRRRLQPRRHEIQSERTRQRLLGGHDWQFLDGPDLTEAELKAVWSELRDELLAEHVREHPGSRPWAWWYWEAPESRQQVADGPSAVGKETWFGMPRCYDGVPPDGMYESEAAYLERLGLLNKEERRRLAELGRSCPTSDMKR
jgi:hypothetical protein